MQHGIKNIAILGSTGSIGTQTLDVIEQYPHLFRASILTAHHNWRLLAEQALKFLPDTVVIADQSNLPQLRNALKNIPTKVEAGHDAVCAAAEAGKIDMVVVALVGYSGLLPTIRAIRSNKQIALANKETLVVGGELIYSLLPLSGSKIIPVDSEHSAIFQCLQGESSSEADKIILTASGGPFRNTPVSDMDRVTPLDALRHPNWKMGNKVTIDSASMMNKGFEMIEARWLFDCPPEKIEIVVHPQSIVHSMVAFKDGSFKAQLGNPDMHIPIRYALSYPNRLPSDVPHMKLDTYSKLTFERPDMDKFPLLNLAFEAIATGGTAPCVLNAANEVAVEAFLNGEIRFTSMATVARKTLDAFTPVASPSLDDLVETNKEAVSFARQVAKALNI